MSPDLARIRAALDRHRHIFNLQADGLGQKLCAAATDGVQECIAGQHSPSGEGWDYLSPKYEEWKNYQFPGAPIGYLHGLMSDPREVAGELDISPDRAAVTYGITEPARLEAEWFQEGDEEQNRPARRFWGLTPASRDESRSILDDHFKRAV